MSSSHDTGNGTGMTQKKFYLALLIQAVPLTILKLLFYSSGNYTQTSWQFLYWAVTVILVTMIVRRVGIMNYLEAAFAGLLWVIFGIIVDGLVTGQIVGGRMFSTPSLWIGYGVVMLTAFVMHKKRHIGIRHGVYKDTHHHH